MCMTLASGVRRDGVEKALLVSDSPITCYKVMRESPTHTNHYYSPFQEFEYFPNVEYETQISYDTCFHDYECTGETRVEVIRGFHSFVNLKDAEELQEYANKHFINVSETPRKQYVVVECVIPAGTPYHAGQWEDSESNYPPNYASTKIVIGKVVEKSPN